MNFERVYEIARALHSLNSTRTLLLKKQKELGYLNTRTTIFVELCGHELSFSVKLEPDSIRRIFSAILEAIDREIEKLAEELRNEVRA